MRIRDTTFHQLRKNVKPIKFHVTSICPYLTSLWTAIWVKTQTKPMFCFHSVDRCGKSLTTFFIFYYWIENTGNFICNLITIYSKLKWSTWTWSHNVMERAWWTWCENDQNMNLTSILIRSGLVEITYTFVDFSSVNDLTSMKPLNNMKFTKFLRSRQ